MIFTEVSVTQLKSDFRTVFLILQILENNNKTTTTKKNLKEITSDKSNKSMLSFFNSNMYFQVDCQQLESWGWPMSKAIN